MDKDSPWKIVAVRVPKFAEGLGVLWTDSLSQWGQGESLVEA